MQQGHFLGGAVEAICLIFQWFSMFSGNLCSVPVAVFFAKQEMHVFPLFLKVFGLLFFLTGLLYNDLKRQALFMLYVITFSAARLIPLWSCTFSWPRAACAKDATSQAVGIMGKMWMMERNMELPARELMLWH